MRVAVVIPVLNEAAAIGPTVRAVAPYADEVIVVDGNSRDATAAEARQAGAQVLVEARRGYGQACASGVALALDRGADILVFMDGDGADVPEMLPRIVAPLRDDSRDFVLASRTNGTRDKGSMLWHQVLAGRVIGAGIGLATGVRYTDMCAFRAIRPRTLLDLNLREMGYGWNLEMQMRAARAGLRIAEIPVPYRCRIGGQSKVSGNLRGTLRAGGRIIATLVRIAAEPRRPSPG